MLNIARVLCGWIIFWRSSIPTTENSEARGVTLKCWFGYGWLMFQPVTAHHQNWIESYINTPEHGKVCDHSRRPIDCRASGSFFLQSISKPWGTNSNRMSVSERGVSTTKNIGFMGTWWYHDDKPSSSGFFNTNPSFFLREWNGNGNSLDHPW